VSVSRIFFPIPEVEVEKKLVDPCQEIPTFLECGPVNRGRFTVQHLLGIFTKVPFSPFCFGNTDH
jgi:hypothetical protein